VPAGIQIDIKPPTFAPTLLSIDGGGVRGIGSLEFLRQLEAELGSARPIQDYFEAVFATSAGECSLN
jgi:patatin-like phospholipase/acyl hydrolase